MELEGVDFYVLYELRASGPEGLKQIQRWLERQAPEIDSSNSGDELNASVRRLEEQECIRVYEGQEGVYEITVTGTDAVNDWEEQERLSDLEERDPPPGVGI